MSLSYLLDEHMFPAYQVQMLRQEPALVVWRIGTPGAPPAGTPDPEILLWCEVNNFVLVINNRKSMPVHLADHLAAGRHVPGILTVDITRDMAQNLDDLLLAALASAPVSSQITLSTFPSNSAAPCEVIVDYITNGK